MNTPGKGESKVVVPESKEKVVAESSVDSSSDSGSSHSSDESVTSKVSSKKAVGSSPAQSIDSNDESGSSSGSSTSGSDGSGSSSKSAKSDKSQRSVKSGGSAESYKSFNVTASAIELEFKDLPAASIPSVVASVEPGKVVPKTPSVSQKRAQSPLSPIVATPCKSLMLESQSPNHTKKGDVLMEVPKDNVVDGTPGIPCVVKELLEPVVNIVAPTKEINVNEKVEMCTDEVDISDEIKAVDSKRSKSNEATKARKARKKKKKDKVKEMEKSVERLEAAIKLVEEGKILKRHKASANKDKKKKARSSNKKKKSDKKKSGDKVKKVRSRPSHKSDSSTRSTDSQSSDEPGTSTRIGMIPKGRKLQRLAMSKTKELGLIKDGKIHALNLTEALRRVDTVQFKILPTQAYKWFHRIPGSHLPHIKRWVKDIQSRYNSFLRTVAKLFLKLAQEQNRAQIAAIGPEATNDYAQLWQFENDLIRASAAPDKPVDERKLNELEHEGSPASKKARVALPDVAIKPTSALNEPVKQAVAPRESPAVEQATSSRAHKKKDRKK